MWIAFSLRRGDIAQNYPAKISMTAGAVNFMIVPF